MDKSQFENYLKSRYEKEIAWYDKGAERNHLGYYIFQWLAIVLSATTAQIGEAGGVPGMEGRNE